MTRWKRWVVVDAILIALSIANGWYWLARRGLARGHWRRAHLRTAGDSVKLCKPCYRCGEDDELDGVVNRIANRILIAELEKP
jgi:hypothetical protein